MKILKVIFILAVLMNCSTVDAQIFKKLAKKAEKAAERTVERRVERESEKKTDQALDSVFDKKGNKKSKRKNRSKKGEPNPKSEEVSKASTKRDINRAPDFEPGNVSIFDDRFSKENPGDFPANWDTNGSGELVIIDGVKWLRLGGNSTYVPILDKAPPEDYTIEFDLLVTGLDKKTSSSSRINLLLEDTERFGKPKSFAMVELSPSQFIESQGVVEKNENGKRIFRNKIGKDYREAIDGQSHISIAINKSRMRIWMNENKLIDIPRLVPEGKMTFKLQTLSLRDEFGKDEVYISNFKMASAGEDNRSKLLTEGKLSTNAIQFESGSDKILPSSFAIIREIASVLEQNPEVNIAIIGHTDSDGDDSSNLILSQQRAASVKKAMHFQYGIAEKRMQTEGKGENDPIVKNTSEAGKAQNRRVEFIKL